MPPRTIRAKDGRALVFSCQEFVENISLGQSCFVCGAPPDSKEFNDEHVVPRWLLKRCSLFQSIITLADGQARTYGQYKLPCCKECNSLLGREIEAPVSKLLAGGYDDIVKRLDVDHTRLLFVWLCLLFLKTHLKDRSVPNKPDPRLSRGWLADAYDWADLHHLHCVARTPYTRADIDWDVLGSITIFPIADEIAPDIFDYGDFTMAQTISLRIGDFGVAAVLNDSRAAQTAWRYFWPEITGPLSTTQLRELATRLAWVNDALLNRPVFGTVYSAPEDAIRIYAERDAGLEFAELDWGKFGEMLAYTLRERMDRLTVAGEHDPAKVQALIRTGRVSFLFNQDGQFRRSQTEWIRLGPIR